MLSILSRYLPTTLVVTGIAALLVFYAVAFLSLNNPLAVALLLVAGTATGGITAGFGLLLRYTAETAGALRQVRADIRAQTEAVLDARRPR
ncbi:MAG TPA: hypothetical protein VF178_14810 [Gemmatimonadaceae bacterium]